MHNVYDTVVCWIIYFFYYLGETCERSRTVTEARHWFRDCQETHHSAYRWGVSNLLSYSLVTWWAKARYRLPFWEHFIIWFHSTSGLSVPLPRMHPATVTSSTKQRSPSAAWRHTSATITPIVSALIALRCKTARVCSKTARVWAGRGNGYRAVRNPSSCPPVRVGTLGNDWGLLRYGPQWNCENWEIM